jgi:membrane peptidoglycan carboxypeptidase
MDPTTGEILAYVGSKDYYDHSAKVQGDYDVAGIALRQPGSTFKLFTYLTGMLKGGMTASTVLNDVQFNMSDGSGSTYSPKDATKEQHGPTTIRQSLRESLNLPALNVARMVGVPAIIDTIHQLGINRDFDLSRLGISFGIGAGEMRLIDMASAYQVVANYGRRIEPTFISKIVDSSGNVVKDYTGKPESKQVIDERYAWVMTNILKDNTDPVHGSFVFGPFTSIGRPAALKTGTTDNLQDVLAIGYTPTRLTAIWMGNSDNSEMNGISSALGPGILWRDYMKIVTGALPPDGFPRPAGIVDRVVCVNPALTGGNGSGLLPGPNCPSSFRWTESYVQGTEPTIDDRNVYLPGGCYKISIPFSDWAADIGRWASAANGGAYNYGRFNWNICGYSAPKPSGSPAPSGGPGAPSPTPPPATQPPKPTKKP